MRRSSRYCFFVFAFFIMCLASGCASYRAGDLQPLSKWPPYLPSADYRVRRIAITGSAEYTVNGNPTRVGSQLLGMVKQNAVDAYLNSGLFTIADPKTNYQPEYYIEVNLIDKNYVNSAELILSALTLFIREGTMTDKYTLVTTIKDSKGEVLGTVEKSETIVYKQRIGLFFSMFGSLPDAVAKDTIYDLNRASINEAMARDIFRLKTAE